MTIDLRGIGDAVRAAAAGRGQTAASFAKQALVAASGPQALTIEQLDLPASPSRSVAKLHLRMDEREANVLTLKARAGSELRRVRRPPRDRHAPAGTSGAA